MNLSLVLFTVGVIMITAGYTNQISPQCSEEPNVRVVPRKVYDEILMNQELTDTIYNDMIGVKKDKSIGMSEYSDQ